MKKKIALMLAAVMLLTTTGSMAYASELSDAAIVGEDRSDFPGEVTGEAAVYSDVSEDAAALIAESTTYAVDIDVTYGQTAARSMLDMINALRTGDDAWYWSSDDTTKVVCSGLSELTYSYELEKIAMQRAAEIAISYSHTRPDNSTCWTAYDEVTFIYYAAGENISAGFTDASSVFASWSEEDENYSGQGHRRNMLDSYFNTVGIGHVYYNGYHYWVQEFAYTPNSSTATAANDSVTTVTVNVASSNISSVTLTADPSSCSLTVGESAALPVLTTKIKLSSTWPSSMLKVAADYTWTVADSSCAVISGDQLQAKAEGSTTLAASARGDTLDIPGPVESASASELIDLSDASVELSQSDYTYDGEEKTPTVTVKYNSVALNAGTDYTVAYSNNVDVGTATVTVTGAGDYTGTITKTFTISASQTESESESESESETESEMESETSAELKIGLALNPEDGI
ncbi:MAG: CAP domain-containing protein [Lachnospiraceae bacterium]|nr:CAP domain-containing protein [Lachnospiraceae bacterium]